MFPKDMLTKKAQVSATLGTYVLAMLLYPDVQRKAQEEVDSVVGRDRLPRAEDLDKLPYLEAVLKEVTRWHTVARISTLPCQAARYGRLRLKIM